MYRFKHSKSSVKKRGKKKIFFSLNIYIYIYTLSSLLFFVETAEIKMKKTDTEFF